MSKKDELLDWLVDADVAELYECKQEKFDEAFDAWKKIAGSWSGTYNYLFLLDAFQEAIYSFGVTREAEQVWGCLKQPLAYYVEHAEDTVMPVAPVRSLMQCETKIPVATLLSMSRILYVRTKFRHEQELKNREKEYQIAAALDTTEGRAVLKDAMIDIINRKISAEKMAELKQQAEAANREYFSNSANLDKFVNDMALHGYDPAKLKANIKRNLNLT